MKTSSIKVGQLTVRQHVRYGSPTGRWYVDLPAKVTGHRRRMLFDNQKKAVEMAREVNRRLSIAGVPAIPQAPCPPTLAELARLWLEKQSLRVETLKKRTASLNADRHRLKPLIGFLGDVPVSLLNESRMLAYQQHRLRQGRRPATINSEVGTLKRILKEGVKKTSCRTFPRSNISPKAEKHQHTEPARDCAAS